MRYLMFFIAVFLGYFSANAQQYQFVYMQTDNKQPFYVRVNDQLYSSSSTGYIVIPKLQSGGYTMSIGFPKNEWPAQQINVKVAEKDLGFVLKNFDSKGWGLFNLQTMEVLSATSTPVVAPNEVSDGNMFSEVLADVVNTPSIKASAKEVKKTEATDLAKAAPVDPVIVPVKSEKPVTETLTTVGSGVQKLSTLRDTEGTVVTYLDSGPLSKDTVRILLPAENPGSENKKQFAEETPLKQNTLAPTINTDEKSLPVTTEKESVTKNATDPRFLEMELPNPNNTKGKDLSSPKEVSDAVFPKKETENASGLKMINSDCNAMAGEEDFYKIRKNMSAARNEDDMINAARKMFRQKCYSTEHVKNLAMLFLTDEGKYKFFDAAYPYIYDSGNFPSLQTELTDEYYIKRFKAMIRK